MARLSGQNGLRGTGTVVVQWRERRGPRTETRRSSGRCAPRDQEPREGVGALPAGCAAPFGRAPGHVVRRAAGEKGRVVNEGFRTVSEEVVAQMCQQ